MLKQQLKQEIGAIFGHLLIVMWHLYYILWNPFVSGRLKLKKQNKKYIVCKSRRQASWAERKLNDGDQIILFKCSLIYFIQYSIWKKNILFRYSTCMQAYILIVYWCFKIGFNCEVHSFMVSSVIYSPLSFSSIFFHATESPLRRAS